MKMLASPRIRWQDLDPRRFVVEVHSPRRGSKPQIMRADQFMDFDPGDSMYIALRADGAVLQVEVSYIHQRARVILAENFGGPRGLGRALYDYMLDWCGKHDYWMEPDTSVSNAASKVWHNISQDPTVTSTRQPMSGPSAEREFNMMDSDYLGDDRPDWFDASTEWKPDNAMHLFRRYRRGSLLITAAERKPKKPVEKSKSPSSDDMWCAAILKAAAEHGDGRIYFHSTIRYAEYERMARARGWVEDGPQVPIEGMGPGYTKTSLGPTDLGRDIYARAHLDRVPIGRAARPDVDKCEAWDWREVDYDVLADSRAQPKTSMLITAADSSLVLQRNGYQRYIGECKGKKVWIGAEEVALHGSFPGNQRQRRVKVWRVKVNGIDVGPEEGIQSFRDARREAIKACRSSATDVALGADNDELDAELELEGDLLPGGEADDMADEDFDPEELALGEEDEQEHTDNPEVAREIAKDRLVNEPEYYTKHQGQIIQVPQGLLDDMMKCVAWYRASAQDSKSQTEIARMESSLYRLEHFYVPTLGAEEGGYAVFYTPARTEVRYNRDGTVTVKGKTMTVDAFKVNLKGVIDKAIAKRKTSADAAGSAPPRPAINRVGSTTFWFPVDEYELPYGAKPPEASKSSPKFRIALTLVPKWPTKDKNVEASYLYNGTYSEVRVNMKSTFSLEDLRHNIAHELQHFMQDMLPGWRPGIPPGTIDKPLGYEAALRELYPRITDRIVHFLKTSKRPSWSWFFNNWVETDSARTIKRQHPEAWPRILKHTYKEYLKQSAALQKTAAVDPTPGSMWESRFIPGLVVRVIADPSAQEGDITYVVRQSPENVLNSLPFGASGIHRVESWDSVFVPYDEHMKSAGTIHTRDDMAQPGVLRLSDVSPGDRVRVKYDVELPGDCMIEAEALGDVVSVWADSPLLTINVPVLLDDGATMTRADVEVSPTDVELLTPSEE